MYKRRLYNAQLTMLQAEIVGDRMGIERLWPGTNWNRIWKNLWPTPAPETTKAIRYKTLHDILPTNERLHKINISPTDRCTRCQEKGTIQHRITGCEEGSQQWSWTKQGIAYVLWTDPMRIPDVWPLQPDFTLWPPKRHRSVLWLLSHYVCYRTRQYEGPKTLDYFDFLKRCRWKFYRGTNRLDLVGNYLSTLDM